MADLSELFAECARLATVYAKDYSTVSGVDVGYEVSDTDLDLARSPVRVRRHRFGAPSWQPLSSPVGLPRPPIPVQEIFARYGKRGPEVSELALPTDDVDTARHRPPLPGTSISRVGNSRWGTLGLLVRQRSGPPGEAFGLSAAHVLRRVAGTRSDVRQPASRESGNNLGVVHSWIDCPLGDAGIFRITTPEPVAAAPQFGTQVQIGAVNFAALGDYVTKSGVATAVTHGRVDGIGYYRLDQRSPLMMGIRIRALPGATDRLSSLEDSGAVWFRSDTTTGVGLHTGYGEDDTRRYAIASHLPCVMQALGVTLL